MKRHVKKKGKPSEDLKNIGMAIILASVLGFILVMFTQEYAFSMFPNDLETASLLGVIGSSVSIFLMGALAMALVSKTKKPLKYGLAASSISVLVITLASIFLTVIMSFGIEYTLALQQLVSSIPTNIVIMAIWTVIAFLGGLVFWALFSRNEEMEPVILAFKGSLEKRLFLVAFVGSLLLSIVSFMSSDLSKIGWLSVVSLVMLIVFSWIIAYILGNPGPRGVLRVIATGIIDLLVILAIIGIPIMVLQTLNSIILLGLLVPFTMVLLWLALVFLAITPVATVRMGIIPGFKKAFALARHKFLELLGLLTGLYGLLFIIQVIQLALLFLTLPINQYLATIIYDLLMAYILVATVLGLKNTWEALA